MPIVALYFDKRTREPGNFCCELRRRILQHFNADGINFCFRNGEDEAESGVDWENKHKRDGVVAIVVCEGDTVCAKNIYREANGYAPKGVYHRTGDKIVEVIDRSQHRKKKIIDISHQ